MEEREKVGKISWDLLAKNDPVDHSPEEQRREQIQEWESYIQSTITDGIRFYLGDFYIVIETKREKNMSNVIRSYFFHRISCPTPTWDNSVFKYHRAQDRLEFLWVLPDKNTCYMIKERALELPSEQKDLVRFVLDDFDGTLLKRCKQLNGEI